MHIRRWLFPTLVLATIVSGVWYAVQYRPHLVTVATSNIQAISPTQKAVASAQPAQLVAPIVQKNKGQLQFSVNTQKIANVQKVEYYVENQFVGTAFKNPYTISIDEGHMQPGVHQVVAKVFTDTDTTESLPASFSAVATPPSQQTPASNTTETTPPVTTPTATPAPGAPSNVVATADDSSSVSLTWSAPTTGTTAVQYEIWRDGSRVDTTTGTNYLDRLATPGNYSYQIIAVDINGNASDPSTAVTVTVPPASNPATTDQASAAADNTTV